MAEGRVTSSELRSRGRVPFLSETSLCHKSKPEPAGLEVSDHVRPSRVKPAVPAETSDSNRVQPGSAEPGKINQPADLRSETR